MLSLGEELGSYSYYEAIVITVLLIAGESHYSYIALNPIG